jgi:ABC-2 type transport system permease protein
MASRNQDIPGPRPLAGFLVSGAIAADREPRLLELKRALAMPRGLYLAAEVAMAMLFAAVVSPLLIVLAPLAAGVTLTLLRWSTLLLLAAVGVIPFCANGLLVSPLCEAQAAPAVLNLICLPMSFFSGLWQPLSVLPPALSRLAPLWSDWQLARIAETVVGSAAVAAVPGHVLSLAAIGTGCFAAARRALGRRRQEAVGLAMPCRTRSAKLI